MGGYARAINDVIASGTIHPAMRFFNVLFELFRSMPTDIAQSIKARQAAFDTPT